MLKRLYKAIVTRATRSAFVETNERIDTLAHEVASLHASRVGIWRGGLKDGAAVLDDGTVSAEQSHKYRGELAFWVDFAAEPERFLGHPGTYQQAFGSWQRERLRELGEWLEVDDTDAWCAERTSVELGSGPYPMISVARWRRAVAVDPIADGYAAEGLLPTDGYMDGVVLVAAPGEHVPLASGIADLVVIENCLDHVSDPKRVVNEIVRLLRPGGHLWLLVDLMDYTDEMHPHAFNEERLRALLASSGLEAVRERIRTDHKSHPEAYADFRTLMRKPHAVNEPEVTVRAGAAPARV